MTTDIDTSIFGPIRGRIINIWFYIDNNDFATNKVTVHIEEEVESCIHINNLENVSD